MDKDKKISKKQTELSDSDKDLLKGLVEELGKKVESAVDKAVEAKFEAKKAKKATNALEDLAKKDSFIAKLLKGKDLTQGADQLTSKEKMVAFFYAAVNRDTKTLKALSEGTAADGGYLFPDEFRSEIVRELEDTNALRSLVRVIPMRRDTIDWPSLVSSVKVYWTAENAAKSTTTAHFGEKSLTARKVAAILYASDELIEDSQDIDVVNLIIELFAEAIRTEEERVIVAGNGTTEPEGLTQATIASRSVAGDLSFDEIKRLDYLLPVKYRRNATWVINPVNVEELALLKDNDGRYLWQDAVTENELPRLMGRPVYETAWCPEDEIYFGDLRIGYVLGDRKRMTVKVSQDTETAFTKDQTAIRVVERIGGLVILPAAIRKLISIP